MVKMLQQNFRFHFLYPRFSQVLQVLNVAQGTLVKHENNKHKRGRALIAI